VGDTECCEHVFTEKISEGLYVEHFRTFCAGVFGEVTQCYITDSVNFRQNIGSYDEHEKFRATLDGDKVEAYNLRIEFISDTVEKRTIGRADLLKYHHNDKNILLLQPFFGKNTIKCDSNFYLESSYKTKDGNYMAEVQYKCGDDYSNAVFYTDSLKFCVFIGIWGPGSLKNNFSVRKEGENFEFYNIAHGSKTDTVKVQRYLLADLKKGEFKPVCVDGKKKE